ncbi:Beta-adaptin-like protein [Gracilaria domingensis]|nr:Beta-adaptin-like protein [Gracilaria domingensis]
MIERIVPRLQHANAAVVLAAVKIIAGLMPMLDSQEKRDFLVKKMGAPLISLLTVQPELQFAALRNFILLLGEYPSLFSNDIRAFFVSYADPLYVKTEKLNILVRLTNESNAESVLAELVEYSGDVDVQFAQKAIASISRIAIRLPQLSGSCVHVFSDMLRKKMPHLTEEVAIALKDVLRCYPRQFDDIVPQLCESAEHIEDPKAKSALVWIIGEHADRLPSAVSMLDVIVDGIHEETIAVQQQALTACVKAFVLRGAEAEKVTRAIILYATEESESIDLRDRGFVYQRLLDCGVETAQSIVLSNKLGIEHNHTLLSPELSKELLASLSSIAAVYHQPPSLFQSERKRIPFTPEVDEAMAEEDLLGLSPAVEEPPESTTVRRAITDGSAASSQPVGDSFLDDILGSSSDVPALPPPGPPDSGVMGDLGLGALVGQPDNKSTSTFGAEELLRAEHGKGLAINGRVHLLNSDSYVLGLELQNHSQVTMSDFALQLNKNMFAFGLASPINVQQIVPNSSVVCEVPLHLHGEVDDSKGFELQIAIKYTPGGVFYFAVDCSKHLGELFDRAAGAMPKPRFLEAWRKVPDHLEVSAAVSFCKEATESLDWISSKLATCGIYTVAKRAHMKPPVVYLSAQLPGPSKHVVMGEVTLPKSTGAPVGKISSRSTLPATGNDFALMAFNNVCSVLLG